ncbi:MAG: methyltransferase domain-containing protein, partial [Phycisphaerales bacterium]|nr:methyltransferase domain-containing protein [Phycisphaerales bacterium]
MRSLAPNGRFERGISVGCGGASKELRLLKNGIVESFDLYEISQVRVDEGIKLAKELGLEDRVRFHVADAFDECVERDFDLVYWNNALHHMLDVGDAIRWSHNQLCVGGWCVMDDFVGACRFQWPDSQLEMARRVREMLPSRFMLHPHLENTSIPTSVSRPDPEALKADDPAEAADSDRILS